MTLEEKKSIAKAIYKNLGTAINEFEISNIAEINADIFLPVENQRGIGGVIIGSDGSYHVCGSIYPLEHYIAEFKNGVRDNIDESLKLSNGTYAVDEETKEAFENYMKEVNHYNEQVANGEEPNIALFDLLNKYRETFYDESLENKINDINEEYANSNKDTRIDDLINRIDDTIQRLNDAQNITFEEAKEQATKYANECNKKIIGAKENIDYYYFETEKEFDDGVGNCYINKKDGKLIPEHLWLPEMQELKAKFRENSKVIDINNS